MKTELFPAFSFLHRGVMSNCITDIKTIHRFLTLTEGNWRNSIYIECKTCKYAPHGGCADYLCIPDENGTPVLLPVSDAKVLFTKYIDPSECLLWISHNRFLEIYRGWNRKHCTEQDKCPFLIKELNMMQLDKLSQTIVESYGYCLVVGE